MSRFFLLAVTLGAFLLVACGDDKKQVCAENNECSSGLCQLVEGKSWGYCAECTNSDHCGWGEKCVSYTCMTYCDANPYECNQRENYSYGDSFIE
jgi:hypothetical protein